MLTSNNLLHSIIQIGPEVYNNSTIQPPPSVDTYAILGDIVVPIIVAVVGVIITFHVHKFEKKRYEATSEAEKQRTRLTGLAEAFRLLNDVRHREARRVLYNMDKHNHSSVSYSIIGIPQFDINGHSNHLALEKICKEIVKNDCNEIGVLGYNGYLDEEKFIKEGFWVILKVWDSLKGEIMDRREKDSELHMRHLERLRNKACEYAKKEDFKVYTKFCSDMEPVAKDNANDAPTNP